MWCENEDIAADEAADSHCHGRAHCVDLLEGGRSHPEKGSKLLVKRWKHIDTSFAAPSFQCRQGIFNINW
jgi:hypothetical protein